MDARELFIFPWTESAKKGLSLLLATKTIITMFAPPEKVAVHFKLVESTFNAT